MTGLKEAFQWISLFGLLQQGAGRLCKQSIPNLKIPSNYLLLTLSATIPEKSLPARQPQSSGEGMAPEALVNLLLCVVEM